MPKVIERKPNKRNSVHDYDKWFAKKKFSLTRGVDFSCQLTVMRANLWKEAKYRQCRACIHQSEDGNTLHVTVSPAPAEGARRKE